MTRDPSSTSSSRPQIQAHVERHLGPVTRAFREGDIDILCVDAAFDRPVHMLVTAGMSDAAMTPARKDAPDRIELMMTLPEQWKLDGLQSSDPRYWPIRLLADLAMSPRQTGRALAWGDTVPNGDPPAPYVSDTKLCAVIIAPSLLVQKEFYALDTGRHHIEFYAAIPLYREELDAHAEHGMEFLLTRMLEHRVNDLVDVKRRNVMKKRFGLF
ncbi:MAG TPA: suppressor of fused domain protein [Povalibacter sp.]|uniref:suppressor of fused domain protein n=1 Tax=Povalibacter sp. TaxID=1962978 RepID=UPI002C0584AE|nr:suppressor of fused domain protein [Povalibacter sp.]HMN43079.1 suppressor of fused domain protein [Povalibacter sp.]